MKEVQEREMVACTRVEIQRVNTIKKYLRGKNQQTMVTVWTWRLREREMFIIIKFLTISFFLS